MTLVRNNYRNLNNLFDEFFGNIPAVNPWNAPAVNIHETTDAYHVELVAPGLNKEDFKISIEKGLLSIGYEKQKTEESRNYKTHKKEFVLNSFKRSFNVEDLVNADAVQAKYEGGILKVYLPKKEDVKAAPKQITIE